MKWFAHESNASSDAKVKKLILAYGAEGYAVYFHCLELIASDINENHINFELEHDSEIVADNLKIKGTSSQSGKERVEEIMRKIVELNLFQEDQGRLFCLQLARRVSSAQIKNEKLKSIQLVIEERLSESSKKFLENSKEFRLPTNNTNQHNQQYQEEKTPEKTASIEALAISQILIDEHRKIDPDFMIGKESSRLKAWSLDIDKINRLDKRDWKTIEAVMRWCKQDSFWCNNIMSGSKFREKFDRLYAGMSSPSKTKGSKVGLGGSDQNKDYSVPEEYKKGGTW